VVGFCARRHVFQVREKQALPGRSARRPAPEASRYLQFQIGNQGREAELAQSVAVSSTSVTPGWLLDVGFEELLAGGHRPQALANRATGLEAGIGNCQFALKTEPSLDSAKVSFPLRIASHTPLPIPR